MARWSEFAAASPRLAQAVHSMLHQYGPGLGYLGTVRADGGPRVHPVSPVVFGDGLYCFLVASPKRGDLDRDGRYALHTFPCADGDDEAYLTGRAHRVGDEILVKRLAIRMRAEPRLDWRLYELSIEAATVVRRGMSSGTSAVVAVGGAVAAVGGGVAVEAVTSTVPQIWRDPGVRSRMEPVDSVQ